MSEPAQYFIFITHASRKINAISQTIADFCYSAHVSTSFLFSEYTYFTKEKTLPVKEPAPAGQQELLTNLRSLLKRNVNTVSLSFHWNGDPDFDISLLLPAADETRILLIRVSSNFFIPENKLESRVVTFIQQLWLQLQPYYGYGIVDIITEYPRAEAEYVKRLDEGYIERVYSLNLLSNMLISTLSHLDIANVSVKDREVFEDGSIMLIPGTLVYCENDATDQNIGHISRKLGLR